MTTWANDNLWDHLPDIERCQVCGQPDNCGECTHESLSDADVQLLTTAKCRECGRVFNMRNSADVDEWFYGHDCEDIPDKT